MTDYTNYAPQHAQGFTSEGAVVQDNLFDDFKVRRKVTILSGAGALLRGTALGRIKTGAATSAVKASGANTGNATMSAITVPGITKVGVYTVRMLTATTFTVEDPDGYVLGNGATGTAFADDIGFTMTAGGTPMVAGDGFDVTVAAGSGKWVKSLAAAVDGSQVVRAILLHDADATSADVEAIVGRIGQCNPAAVILGAGHTLASIEDACLDRGIVFESVIG